MSWTQLYCVSQMSLNWMRMLFISFPNLWQSELGRTQLLRCPLPPRNLWWSAGSEMALRSKTGEGWKLWKNPITADWYWETVCGQTQEMWRSSSKTHLELWRPHLSLLFLVQNQKSDHNKYHCWYILTTLYLSNRPSRPPRWSCGSGWDNLIRYRDQMEPSQGRWWFCRHQLCSRATASRTESVDQTWRSGGR